MHPCEFKRLGEQCKPFDWRLRLARVDLGDDVPVPADIAQVVEHLSDGLPTLAGEQMLIEHARLIVGPRPIAQVNMLEALAERVCKFQCVVPREGRVREVEGDRITIEFARVGPGGVHIHRAVANLPREHVLDSNVHSRLQLGATHNVEKLIRVG